MSDRDLQLSKLSVGLDEAAMVAVLSIEPGFDAEDDEALDHCVATLESLGIVVHDSAREQLRSGLEAFASRPKAKARIEVHGRKPTHGEDGWFEWADGMDPHERGPASDGEETVDYYNQSRYVCVEQGDVLGTVHPPTFGSPGVNLLGLPVDPRPGKSAVVLHDDTVTRDDGDRLIAAVPGSVEMLGREIRIARELDIHRSVDFGTGNIAFDGNVIVRGGVRDNFRVEVTDDLRVSEVIEAARIEVGRDLYVGGGITGHERAVIRVGRHAYAMYALQATLDVTRDLRIQRELINSTTEVGGDLLMPSGDLVGGTAHVMGSVQVAVIGSEGGTSTVLHLASSPRLEQQIMRVTAERNALRAKLEPIQAEIDQAGASGDTTAAEDGMHAAHLRSRVPQLMQQLSRVESLLSGLSSSYASLRRVELHVRKVIYPGTRLVVGDVVADVHCGLEGPLTILSHDRDGLVVREAGGSQLALSTVARLGAAA